MSPLDVALMRTPWVLGGRAIGEGIDCFGVVLHKLRQRGIDFPDPWQSLAADWQAGIREVGSLMPPGWRRVDPPAQDGDLVILGRSHVSIGFVEGASLWTALREQSPVRVPLYRVPRTQSTEIWRRE